MASFNPPDASLEAATNLHCHNEAVDNLKARVDELAELMAEFKLTEAELSGESWRVAFKTRSAAPPTARVSSDEADEEDDPEWPQAAPALPASAPHGMPVNSPMNGIYYTAPSPSAPPFVKEGEPVTAGQVVGLIEAMKVFNEIVAPISGTVTAIVASTGQLVQPGDPLVYIG